MKRFIVLVAISIVMCSLRLYAQKVYKQGNKVILDLTQAAGMPPASITGAKKTWVGTATNNGLMGNNDEYAEIHAKVYQKLEIAPHNLTSSTGFSSAAVSVNWANAFNWCRTANYNSGGWRLPTQRELLLIYIFESALNEIFKDGAINGTAFSFRQYWSTVEYGGTSAWNVNFGNGGLSDYDPKGNTYVARCVREVN